MCEAARLKSGRSNKLIDVPHAGEIWDDARNLRIRYHNLSQVQTHES